MQTSIELWIAILAVAMCVFLHRRVPMTPTPWWWWSGSWAAGTFCLLLAAAAGTSGASGEAGGAIVVLRALCDAAQISLAVLGL